MSSVTCALYSFIYFVFYGVSHGCLFNFFLFIYRDLNNTRSHFKYKLILPSGILPIPYSMCHDHYYNGKSHQKQKVQTTLKPSSSIVSVKITSVISVCGTEIHNFLPNFKNVSRYGLAIYSRIVLIEKINIVYIQSLQITFLTDEIIGN